MKLSIEQYEDTGNPKILLDDFPITTNYCHLPDNQTALDTATFPDVLQSLLALGICEFAGHLVKCNAGTFPVIKLNILPGQGIEI